jgi:hypothetical protein
VPIQSGGVSGKGKSNYSKMAASFRDIKTSITTMRAKNQAFAIFPIPLISHYPLPLSKVFDYFIFSPSIVCLNTNIKGDSTLFCSVSASSFFVSFPI